MVHIAATDANAWLDQTKLTLTSIETSLETQISNLIISKLAAVYDVSTWGDTASTPSLVKTVISMYYAAAVYERQYADDATDGANYSFVLRRMADSSINQILSGDAILAEVPDTNINREEPAFFPNDASSANDASYDFPHDGAAAFTMGGIF